jgi:hypothetical protein
LTVTFGKYSPINIQLPIILSTNSLIAFLYHFFSKRLLSSWEYVKTKAKVQFVNFNCVYEETKDILGKCYFEFAW